MKAIFIPETGGPEVLTYGDRPEPEIGGGDLLVRVRAAALNRRDLFAREGSHGVKPPLPHIPGLEVAGEVVEAGPETTGFKAGDRVLGRCRGGGYAELARMEAADAYTFPEWMPFEEAACIAVPFGTAWRMLVRRAELKSGEDLLVMAAGSGIGSGAIQLGKVLGARVDHHRKLAVEARQGRGTGRRRGHQLQGIPRVQSKGQGAHRRRGRARDLRARGRAGVARVLRQPPAGAAASSTPESQPATAWSFTWASSGLAS